MMQFNEIQKIISTDLEAVNQTIHQHLDSSIPLASEIGEYIVASGGKRIRPILVLLSTRLFNYQGQKHILLATIVELLHTATLLHDDVIDRSQMRRGCETANQLWGNQAAVLVGDLLHARAFQMIAQLQDEKIIKILAAATSVIVEGELLQLTHCHDPNTSEQTYLEIIHHKTGKLFELATHLGAILCQRSPTECQAMIDYGKNMGSAFQLIDDILDYSGDDKQIGKNIGDDLAEGKPTLPLIYALQHGNSQQQALLQQAVKEGADSDIVTAQKIISETGALNYAKKCAEQFVAQAQKSLKIMPDSPARQALHGITEFALQRQK